MQRLTQSFATKSAKIRTLASAGYKRQQIADFLGIRYQHVRNVLVQAPSYRTPKDQPGRVAEAEESSPRKGDKSRARSGVFIADPQGRITLPAELLEALDAKAGRPIPWRFDGGELKLMNVDARLRHARHILGKHLARISTGAFLAERRREAESEEPRE